MDQPDRPPPPVFALAEMPVPLVYTTHRIIRDCNVQFGALFGFAVAELRGTSFSRLYPEIDDFVRTGRMWSNNLPGGRVYHDERIMQGAGGRRFWCRVNGRARCGADPFAEVVYAFEALGRPVTQAAGALTGRQRQIMTLVAQGRTNNEIAAEIGLSARTVEAHRLRLARLVGARNGAELVAWFLEGGYPSAGPP